MSASWHGLLANLAIIAILISVWTHVHVRIEDRSPALQNAFLTLLGGGGTVLLMLLPFEIQPGVFVDLRATLIALSGFFGGAVVGLATGVVAGACRAWLGGAGWAAGVAGIGIAAFVGIAGRYLLKGQTPTTVDVLYLAVATAVSGLAGFFFLPRDIWMKAVPTVGLPLATVNFVSTIVAGLAVIQEINRRDTARTNRIYRAIIDALPDPLNVKDVDGHFLASNPATAVLMHADGPQALIGHTDFDFYPPDTAKRFRADEEKVLASGRPLTMEQRTVHRDGSIAWLSTLKAPLRAPTGAIIGLITHNRDITYRKRLEDEYAESQRRLTNALANMADALVMFDKDERLVFCNEQYRQMFAKTADLRMPGARLRDILRASVERGEQVGIPPDEVDAWIEGICSSLHVVSDQDIEVEDGRWLHARVRPIADGASLTVISDVTRIKQAEKKLSELNKRLESLARTDGLTDLINRRAFDEALQQESERSRRNRTPLSLLLIDVDRFKAFNDSYGHPAGDACLRSIAHCVKKTLKRPTDIAARYGGEELAAILPDTSPDGAFQLAEAFRRTVRDLRIPHTGSEKGVVTVSIGVSTLDGGAREERGDLVRRADEALYAAKASGRDCVRSNQPQPIYRTQA